MNKINSDSEMATTCETIHVTHFVNPHCFYFKFDSDLHDDQLQILEDEISKTAHSLIKNGETIARNKGDVVAAYVTQWSKWVRAQICDDLINLERYQLWAIDHGKVFETNYTNVVSLPTDLIDRKIKKIRRGSVHGIRPAKLDLNLSTLKTELKPCETWSINAIQQCIKIFNNRRISKFKFEIKAERDDYFFGNLVWEAHDKKTNTLCQSNFGEALTKIKEAVCVNFDEDLNRIPKAYATDIVNVSYAESIESTELSFNEKSTVSFSPSLVSARSRATNSIVASDITLFEEQNQLKKSIPSIAPSSIAPSEIDGGMTRMNLRKKLRNPTPSIAPSSMEHSLIAHSSIAPSEIDGGMTRMNLRKKLTNPTSSIAPSSIAHSTVAPSEINGGMTRMSLSQKLKNPTPSIASSSILSSEINGGETRFSMKNRQNGHSKSNNLNQHMNRNDAAYMPAGHERAITDFHKYNK